MEPAAGSVVTIAYQSPAIDLSWVPGGTPVMVVHNDETPVSVAGDIHTTDLLPGRNIGFGAAVNLALARVETERVVLVNPDTVLRAEHWTALVRADPHEVVSVPLCDAIGRPTSIVNRYPSPVSHLLSALRVGRWVPRGESRRTLARFLGSWGAAHAESLDRPYGVWPLRERWGSGGVLSLDADRIRHIGGFDERFFMYYEDVDLSQRLARRFPEMVVRVADTPAGVHAVGGSAARSREVARATARHRLDSARTYAEEQIGSAWSVCASLLRLMTRR